MVAHGRHVQVSLDPLCRWFQYLNCLSCNCSQLAYVHLTAPLSPPLSPPLSHLHSHTITPHHHSHTITLIITPHPHTLDDRDYNGIPTHFWSQFVPSSPLTHRYSHPSTPPSPPQSRTHHCTYSHSVLLRDQTGPYIVLDMWPTGPLG